MAVLYFFIFAAGPDAESDQGVAVVVIRPPETYCAAKKQQQNFWTISHAFPPPSATPPRTRRVIGATEYLLGTHTTYYWVLIDGCNMMVMPVI